MSFNQLKVPYYFIYLLTYDNNNERAIQNIKKCMANWPFGKFTYTLLTQWTSRFGHVNNSMHFLMFLVFLSYNHLWGMNFIKGAHRVPRNILMLSFCHTFFVGNLLMFFMENKLFYQTSP
jgi:hypothetical protein